MKIHCQYSELRSPKSLVSHPKNRNKHSKEQIDRLCKILTYQGFRYPIKVSKQSGFITSGHGRMLAAIKLGLNEVPVSIQDYESDEQEYADVQADNAIASWSELDLSAINLDIGELGPDFDIDLLGLKDFTIDVSEKEGLIEDDEIPEAKEARTKLGDLYQLGNHRLLCGDSTDILQVEKLMNGEKADLWLTDPPYGVSYKSNGAENKHRMIHNDSMPLDEMKNFWTDCATSALSACSNKAAYYWFACQGGDQMMMMMMALGNGGWQVKHELIWVKDRLVLGRCDYHYKHEPILYGWRKDGTHEWFGDRSQVSTIECKKPNSSDLHPTMKPIELLEPLIKNSTNYGQNILDLFGGSGSTLIACEKTNRKCFMMELDPHYCDVIVTRWESYTGQKAELLNG